MRYSHLGGRRNSEREQRYSGLSSRVDGLRLCEGRVKVDPWSNNLGDFGAPLQAALDIDLIRVIE